jgi:hypothetical protein
MGSILADIVDDIEIKPNKTKLVLKWVVAVSGSLIATAFLLGQLKTKHINRLDRIETNQLEMKVENRNGFSNVNTRIDKVYDDGLVMFNDFQESNSKQLELIIDYGQDNKEMLKKMLEINTLERKQNIAIQAEQAKNENPVIGVRPQSDVSFEVVSADPYFGEAQFIEVETQDTLFQVRGATKKYINSINKRKYEIGAVIESSDYPGRYDFSYRNK